MIRRRCFIVNACGLIAVAAVFSGCATVQSMQALLTGGPGIGFDANDVAKYEDNQTKVLRKLYVVAGLSADPVDTEWDQVIVAGMDYADEKCEEYLHALFRLNRDKKTAISQIGLLGGAAAGILGAAGAAAKEIAITAIAFGLAASSIDTLSSNLLYELEPSSVRTLVKGLQKAFRDNLPTGYDSRPAAVTVIRSYAILCIPTNIEAEVNLAIKKSQPIATLGDPTAGQPPVVTNNVTSPNP